MWQGNMWSLKSRPSQPSGVSGVIPIISFSMMQPDFSVSAASGQTSLRKQKRPTQPDQPLFLYLSTRTLKQKWEGEKGGNGNKKGALAA